MSLVDQTPGSRRNGRFVIIAVALVVTFAFIVLAAIAIVAGLAVFRGGSFNSQPDATPAVEQFYNGSDALPSGLTATSSLFAASNVSFNLNTFNSSAFPPVDQDSNAIANQASQFQQPVAPTGGPPPQTGVPHPENVGLVVCDPIVTGSSTADLKAFAAGCRDWLQLIAAGQPELGRTANWDDAKRQEQELGRADLCLSPRDARPLASISGVTHVVCGTISGGATNCTLSFQLYSLPGLTPIGSPQVLTGTTPEILALLPKTAAAIDKNLGIGAPDVSASISLSPEELIELENDKSSASLSGYDLTQMMALSGKSPLAGVLFLHTWASNDNIVAARTIHSLFKQAPNNALIVDYLAYANSDGLRPYAAQTQSFIAKFPQNALLAHAEVLEQRNWGSRIPELAAAMRTVQDSPYDPESWISVARTQEFIASDLRHGKFVNDVLSSDWSTLKSLYDQGERDASEAVTLDPKFGYGWHEAGNYSMMAGDGSSASIDCQKAEKLDPYLTEVYITELEQYQPKWFDNSNALYNAANAASSLNLDSASDAVDLANELNNVAYSIPDTRYSTMADNLLIRTFANIRAEIAKDPNNPVLHWRLAYGLMNAPNHSEVREAIKEYRIAVHFLPNSAELHYELAQAWQKRDRPDQEIPELRQAVALDPFLSGAHALLGNEFKEVGNYSKAIPELQCAIRLDPTDSNPYWSLGVLYNNKHMPALAAAEYQMVVKYSPYDAQTWEYLAQSLDMSHQYERSIEAANSLVHIDQEAPSPDNTSLDVAYTTIADDYLNLKQWKASLAASKSALSFVPNEPVSEENIAEAEWGEGNSSAAKAQWEYVATLNSPQMSSVARKYLAEHFTEGSSQAPSPEIQ